MPTVSLFNVLFEQQKETNELRSIPSDDNEEEIVADPSLIPSTPSDEAMEAYLDATFYKPARSEQSVMIEEDLEAASENDSFVDDSDPGFMLIHL